MGLFPHDSLVLGLILALVTAAAFNWSWVAQHTITSRLPALSIRHPVRSLGLLFGHRRWLIAFLVGIAGWALYIVALRLAPLSLVQAVSAGGLAHVEQLRRWRLLGLLPIAAAAGTATTRPTKPKSWPAASSANISHTGCSPTDSPTNVGEIT